MKPDVKELWLTALRSGEYEQAKGTLRGKVADEKEGYCCLGVLCEIAVKQGAIPEPTQRTQAWGETSYFYGSDDDDANDSVLPPSVAEWAGLFYEDDGQRRPATTPEIEVAPDDERYGRDDEDDEYYSPLVELTEMNDTSELGFPIIADYIERYL